MVGSISSKNWALALMPLRHFKTFPSHSETLLSSCHTSTEGVDEVGVEEPGQGDGIVRKHGTRFELSHLIPSALSLEIQPPLQGNTEALAYRPTKSNRLLQYMITNYSEQEKPRPCCTRSSCFIIHCPRIPQESLNPGALRSVATP